MRQQGYLSEHYRGLSEPHWVSICGRFHFRLWWEFPVRPIWQKLLHETAWTTFPVSFHLREAQTEVTCYAAALRWSGKTYTTVHWNHTEGLNKYCSTTQWCLGKHTVSFYFSICYLASCGWHDFHTVWYWNLKTNRSLWKPAFTEFTLPIS